MSALPSLIQQPKTEDASAATIKKSKVTISAKPQITNHKIEVIHFVPTALRVRHENKRDTAVPQRRSQDDSAVLIAHLVWGEGMDPSRQALAGSWK